MMASTGIGPPKQGYVLTVSNPGRALVPLRNSTKLPEPIVVKTLVKEDEPDEEKPKGRQSESISHHIRFAAQEVLSSTTEIRCF